MLHLFVLKNRVQNKLYMSIEPHREPELSPQQSWKATHVETWAIGREAELQEKKEVLSVLVGRPVLYWSGHVANWLYVVATFGVASYLSTAQDLVSSIMFFCFGLWVWTLLEYVFHRWAYHKNASFMAVGHLMHHDEPEALIGMPWVINMASLVGLFLVGSWIFGARQTGFVMSGIWLGHIVYTLVHHGIHHWNFKSAWFRGLKNHHKIHHKMPDKNLGVTTVFWDRLFGTRV